MTYKFQQIKPPKARGVLKEFMWDDPLWVAERKYDGDRRIAQFSALGVRFTGTRESVDGTGFVEKSENLPHLRSFPKDLAGTVLDGEIVSPNMVKGGQSKAVTSIMGSSPERAIALQKATGWLRYVVFDCLYFRGGDMRQLPLWERREYAEKIIKEWGNQHVSLAEQHVNHGSSMKNFFKIIVRDGGEGVVLKHLHQKYGDEKLWVKVKGEWTADVVIMGFTSGKGKYVGNVGAIIMGQYASAKKGGRWKKDMDFGLVQVGTCSGMTDDQRAAFNKGGHKKYGGLVVEIAHNGREPTGAFRHPRFKRFRPDKSPKDCVYREGEI